jgi:hypothetical protein
MIVKYSLEHVGLAAKDTAVLKDWYVRILGARVIFQNTDSPPAYFLELHGGAWIEIYPSNSSVKEISDNKVSWKAKASFSANRSSPRAEVVASSFFKTLKEICCIS